MHTIGGQRAACNWCVVFGCVLNGLSTDLSGHNSGSERQNRFTVFDYYVLFLKTV